MSELINQINFALNTGLIVGLRFSSGETLVCDPSEVKVIETDVYDGFFKLDFFRDGSIRWANLSNIESITLEPKNENF